MLILNYFENYIIIVTKKNDIIIKQK